MAQLPPNWVQNISLDETPFKWTTEHKTAREWVSAPGLGSTGHKDTPHSEWRDLEWGARKHCLVTIQLLLLGTGRGGREEAQAAATFQKPMETPVVPTTLCCEIVFVFFPSCVLRDKKLLLSPPPHSPLKESGPIKPWFQSFYHFGVGWGAQCTQVFIQLFPPTPRKYAPPHPSNGVVRGPCCIVKLLQVVNNTPSFCSEGNFQALNKKPEMPESTVCLWSEPTMQWKRSPGPWKGTDRRKDHEGVLGDIFTSQSKEKSWFFHHSAMNDLSVQVNVCLSLYNNMITVNKN